MNEILGAQTRIPTYIDRISEFSIQVPSFDRVSNFCMHTNRVHSYFMPNQKNHFVDWKYIEFSFETNSIMHQYWNECIFTRNWRRSKKNNQNQVFLCINKTQHERYAKHSIRDCDFLAWCLQTYFFFAYCLQNENISVCPFFIYCCC